MEYKWVALTVTTVGTFMSGMGANMITIGLPTILKDFNANIFHGIWLITGYNLMMAVLMITLGRIADLYGRIRLYNLGFVIFTVGALLCALSQTMEQLILFRFLQGVGAAFLMINSAVIVADSFPRRQYGVGLGVNMMAANLGTAMAYTVGGVMIGLAGWRSLFWMCLPIGFFGTLWAYKRLKEIIAAPEHEKFDYVGSVLYCAGLSAVLIALTIGNFASSNNLVILTVGIALFLTFVVVERRQKHPTLDLSLFKIRLFTGGNLSNFLNSVSFTCGPFLLSLYFQLVMLYSPFWAGVLLVPMYIMVFVFAPISGKLSDKYGARGLSSLGLALSSVSLFLFYFINEKTPYTVIFTGLILFGLGRALFMSPNTSSIMGSVSLERRGVANGVRTTLYNTGVALSVPLSLTFMTVVMPYDQLSKLVGSAQLTNSDEFFRFLGSLNYAFLILGIITAVAIIPSLLRGSKQ